MIPILIGLTGFSGAGKSTLAKHLEEQGGVKRFRFDAFYKDEEECPKIGDLLSRSSAEANRPHWDLPESFHLDQAFEALKELKNGNDIWLPIYSKLENRRTGKIIYQPTPIIFAEGIMLFAYQPIRELFDLRLWLEVSEEEALRRRLERQPNYDPEYHHRVVEPAARELMLPHRALAHAIIDGGQSIREVAAATDAIIHKFLGI
ncbi:MAG: hypothetical protein V1664_02440 [Candidatus Uhrbacteria bacterium]